MTFEELTAAVNKNEIDTVLVCMVDMQGRLIGKRFHANFFVNGGYKETHACDYLLADDIDMEPVPGYAAASWQRGYGDFVLKPDMATLRQTPWLEGTAMVLCDVLDHSHHRAVSHSPRAILKAQLARLDKLGIKALMASELEFYLFNDSYALAREKNYSDLETAGRYIQDYHIFQTTKEEEVMRDIRNNLEKAGIPVENSKGEWGPGQEEINICYGEALEMADRHVILKNACKEIAYGHAKSVSFMAKWNYDLAGSSCHIHQSLWSSERNQPLFLDKSAKDGISRLMSQFMAGQLVYAKEITWFLAPYINSYKRFQAGTFAPTKAIWSGDNRTAGFRVVGQNSRSIRIECRIGGADLNPYLAFAGLIAAGIAGIDNELELEPAYSGDAYLDESLRQIPKTLRDAVDALKNSQMLRGAFGHEVVDHYVHTANWEQSEYDRKVTDWELKRGFELY